MGTFVKVKVNFQEENLLQGDVIAKIRETLSDANVGYVHAGSVCRYEGGVATVYLELNTNPSQTEAQKAAQEALDAWYGAVETEEEEAPAETQEVFDGANSLVAPDLSAINNEPVGDVNEKLVNAQAYDEPATVEPPVGSDGLEPTPEQPV